MTLESYITNKFKILTLTLDKWVAELAVRVPGSNGEEKKALKNIYLKLAISYGIIGDQKKANKLEALAKNYI